MRSQQFDRLRPTQLYSFAGTSTAGGSAVPVQVDNTTYANTNRNEYSTELSVTDHLNLSDQTQAWLGLRYTLAERSSVSLSPTAPNPQSNTSGFTTPWLALSHRYGSGATVYASYGQGVELQAAPNSALYSNAGQFLGVQRSHQIEVGAKGQFSPTLQANAALFRIERPLAYDKDGARVVDGTQTHQGLEGGLQWRKQGWLLAAQAQWLHARLSGLSLSPEQNGSTPLNVPQLTLRALAQYRWAQVPGLRTSLRLSHEGQRRVLEDGSLNLPAWDHAGLGAAPRNPARPTRKRMDAGHRQPEQRTLLARIA